jgi:hypothetical protein
MAMPEFDIDAFITELGRLGVKLTTIRLSDGTYRVNRWRMPEANAHAEHIERLWATNIGDNKTRVRLLADRLLVRASKSPTTAAEPPGFRAQAVTLDVHAP